MILMIFVTDDQKSGIPRDKFSYINHN